MNDFTIRNSLEVEFTKAPAIAIAGPSGSGKTESAMRLARGWCDHFGPEERFIVIDTEEKRALYKKARYQPWDWMDLQPPFTPERTWAALAAVKGYRAVILDSTSHEYAGPGGISEIAEDELEKLAKGDPAKMEKLIAPSWKHAKRRHKTELMANLIRYPTLVICCLRAEPKVKFMKEKFTRNDGSTGEKTVIVDAGYQPICEKMFMYEMLVSVMMYPDKAGIPEHVKELELDLKPVFLQGKVIDEGTGQRLAAWASSRNSAPGHDGPAPTKTAESATTGEGGGSSSPSSSKGAGPECITDAQAKEIRALLKERDIDVKRFLDVGQIDRLEYLPTLDFERGKKWIQRYPVVDLETATLRKIDRAKDQDEAAQVLDSVRDEPFYSKASEAFTRRVKEFNESASH